MTKISTSIRPSTAHRRIEVESTSIRRLFDQSFLTGMLIMSLFSFSIFFTFSVFLIPVSIPPALLPFLLSLYEPCISHLNSFGSHFSVFFPVFQFCPHFCQVYDIKFLYIFPEVLVFISYSCNIPKKYFSFFLSSLTLSFFCAWFLPFVPVSCVSGSDSIWLSSGPETIPPIPFALPWISDSPISNPCSPWLQGALLPQHFSFIVSGWVDLVLTFLVCASGAQKVHPAPASASSRLSNFFACLSFFFSIFYSVDL